MDNCIVDIDLCVWGEGGAVESYCAGKSPFLLYTDCNNLSKKEQRDWELLTLRDQGLTLYEIAERLGYNSRQAVGAAMKAAQVRELGVFERKHTLKDFAPLRKVWQEGRTALFHEWVKSLSAAGLSSYEIAFVVCEPNYAIVEVLR